LLKYCAYDDGCLTYSKCVIKKLKLRKKSPPNGMSTHVTSDSEMLIWVTHVETEKDNEKI